MKHLEASVTHLATGFYRAHKGLLKETMTYENETWAEMAGDVLADRATQWLKNLTDEELAGITLGVVNVKEVLAEVAKRLNA
jgi:hypothetical protein